MAKHPHRMSAYGQIIIEATGCTPEATHAIEEIMRDQSPTLDHLTRAELYELARAASIVRQMEIP